MAFAADEWLDRQRMKRKLLFWRIAGLVALALLLIAVITPWSDDEFAMYEDHIAEVVLEGMILEDQLLIDALTEAEEDESIKAVILRVNSPGGSLVGGESIFNAVRRVAETKPVVAEMGTFAASGGYMVSIAADQIFAHQGTVTGSIGVIMQTATIEELLTNAGIRSTVYKSGPLKAQPNLFESPTPEVDEAMMAVIDDMYDLFVEMVAERREMPEEKVRTLADGRIYTGRQALENGLIDAIGGRRETLEWLQSEKGLSPDLAIYPLAIDYPEEELWMYRISQALGKVLMSEGLTLDGLAAVWQPSP